MDANRIRSEVLYRPLTLDLRAADEAARTVPASLSSETEIKRFFGKELLVHTPEAVNLERAADGLPMLFAHDQDQPIGIVDDVRVEDGRLRGMLRFSKNRRATEIWDDVREGFLKNISIGYRIEKWEEEDDSDLLRVTRWTLYEASVVAVPADHTVGINRQPDEDMMKTTDTNAGAGAGTAGLVTRDDGDDDINVVKFKEIHTQGFREGKAAAKAERRRINGEIHAMFAPFVERPHFREWRDQCVMNEYTLEQARAALYELWVGERPPEPAAADLRQAPGSAHGMDEQARHVYDGQGRRSDRISVGTEAIEKFRDGVTEALSIRAESTIINRPADKERIAKARKDNEFLSMSPVELCREYLRHIGVPFGGMTRVQIVGLALTSRGLISHTTSDFANILEDVSNKSLQIGYEEAPETWQMWCRVGSLPDFKPGNRPNLSAFGDLDVIYEGGEYKYGSFTDLKEVLQLATYGKLFSISRQALVNDDLDALGRVPAAMGRAAARTVGDLPYNILINNPTLLQDATALFHANHSNLVAGGSGAAPSVATIQAARTAMGTQTDPSGSAILNARPAFLICPMALEGTSKAIQMAEKDPSVASGEQPNTVRGTFETVSEGRLDAFDAAAWFMAASPTMGETVEVAFLDGQQTPYMEVQNGWSTDGAAYKVRIDAAAAALDFRYLYMNDGN